MASKLFEARSKLNDLQALRRYLEKQALDQNDYHNLLEFCFDENRTKFLKLVDTIKPFAGNFLNIILKENPILLDLCKIGTAEEVQALFKYEAIKNWERKQDCLAFAVLNTQRKDNRPESLEITKILFAVDAKLITNAPSKCLAEAIQKQQFDLAEFLIEKGIDLSYESPDRQNLLHTLMKAYTKKQQKQILNIRSMLVQRGVDEKKSNVYSKRPYDVCPPQITKKVMEQHKSQVNPRKNRGEDVMKYKGKSEEGSEPGRVRNSECRQKQEISPIFKVDSQDEVYRLADNCIEKRIKQKQKQLNEKEKQRLAQKSKEKEKEKKQKINKRVFNSEELKYFLNEEIKLFMQLIERENEYQKSFLNQLIEKITAEIKEKAGASVKIFGSFATELSLLQSDIDMVIIPSSDKQMVQSSFSLLEKISHLLQTLTDQVETVKFIKTASVPIIKIQCTKKYDSKKIDITYKDQNHNGLNSVELIQNYLSIYPQLRPLVFVLKKFIYSTNIYDPYSGGLSSYGLILMIVAYLQNENRQRKTKIPSEANKPPSIAQLLIGFLYFYGFKSNYINKQICIIDPEKAKAEMQATSLQIYAEQPIYIDAIDIQFMMYPNDWQPRAKLMIVDPLNPKNNIGRATHKIREIKTAFQMAYVCIHTNKNCKPRKNCESYQRIAALNLKDTKYDNYKRPCCIINRMLNSTKSLTAG